MVLGLSSFVLQLCEYLAFFFSEVVHPVQVTNLKAEARPVTDARA